MHATMVEDTSAATGLVVIVAAFISALKRRIKTTYVLMLAGIGIQLVDVGVDLATATTAVDIVLHTAGATSMIILIISIGWLLRHQIRNRTRLLGQGSDGPDDEGRGRMPGH